MRHATNGADGRGLCLNAVGLEYSSSMLQVLHREAGSKMLVVTITNRSAANVTT